MDRRQVLASIGVTSGLTIAGCLGSNGSENSENSNGSDNEPPNPNELEGIIKPDDDPEPVYEELICEEEDFEYIPQSYDEEEIQWGDSTNEEGDIIFSLRATSERIEFGNEFEISLINVSDKVRDTGVETNISIEAYTEEGWEEVRSGSFGNDIALAHEPGEGYNWTFVFNEDQISMSEPTEETVLGDRETFFSVCPELELGRYRFVEWSYNTAVSFDVL